MLANFTTSHHKVAFVFFLLSVPNSACCRFSYNLIHSMFCWINCTYKYKASQLLEISNYCAIKLRVIKTCAHQIFNTILIRLQSMCSNVTKYLIYNPENQSKMFKPLYCSCTPTTRYLLFTPPPFTQLTYKYLHKALYTLAHLFLRKLVYKHLHSIPPHTKIKCIQPLKIYPCLYS